MATDCIAQTTFRFQENSKPVIAAFDMAHASSDGGAVLLKAIDTQLGLTARDAVHAVLLAEREPATRGLLDATPKAAIERRARFAAEHHAHAQLLRHRSTLNLPGPAGELLEAHRDWSQKRHHAEESEAPDPLAAGRSAPARDSS